MSRFHISNGVPSRCKAQPGNCPLGGEHYETLNEASKAAEDATELEMVGDEAYIEAYDKAIARGEDKWTAESRGREAAEKAKAAAQAADAYGMRANFIRNVENPISTSDLDDYVAAHRSEPEFESVASLYRESERRWWEGRSVSAQTLEERLDKAELHGLRKLATLKLDVSEEEVEAADEAKLRSLPNGELRSVFVPGGADVSLHPSNVERASDGELKDLLRLPVKANGRSNGLVRMEKDGSFSGYLSPAHLKAILGSDNASEETKAEAKRRLADL